MKVDVSSLAYCAYLKYMYIYSDRQVWVNSVEPDQTALIRGLHSLPFLLLYIFQMH